MGYDHVLIRTIIDEIAMGPFGSNIKVDCFVNDGVPVLNGSNLGGYKLSEKDYRYVTVEKAQSLNKAVASRGDIVVTHRGTLGQISYIPQNSLHKQYVVSQSQFRFRCKLDVASPQYVVYYFLSKEGQNQLLSNTSQVGVPALARPSTTFQNLEIPLPPIDIQRRIVATLSCLDDKIELNNKINANLEAQAQAIFKNWFVDFEPFQDGEFVDSELGRIPKGWRVGTLDELGTIVGGATPSKAQEEYFTTSGLGIPWITPKDLSLNRNKFISHGELDITPQGMKMSSVKLMPKGSVLFSSRAPIGYMAIAKNEVCTNQGFKSVVPYEEIGTAFLYSLLQYNRDAIENLGSGSTFKEVSGAIMRSVKVIIPDTVSIQDYNTIMAALFELLEKIEAENSILVNLRDTLLPKLMSGDVEVAQ